MMRPEEDDREIQRRITERGRERGRSLFGGAARLGER